jgi:hypothetical protein
VWSEAGSQPGLEGALEIGGFGYPAMAVLNAKKMKYSILRGSFSPDGINEFLRYTIYNSPISFIYKLSNNVIHSPSLPHSITLPIHVVNLQKSTLLEYVSLKLLRFELEALVGHSLKPKPSNSYHPNLPLISDLIKPFEMSNLIW